MSSSGSPSDSEEEGLKQRSVTSPQSSEHEVQSPAAQSRSEDGDSVRKDDSSVPSPASSTEGKERPQSAANNVVQNLLGSDSSDDEGPSHQSNPSPAPHESDAHDEEMIEEHSPNQENTVQGADISSDEGEQEVTVDKSNQQLLDGAGDSSENEDKRSAGSTSPSASRRLSKQQLLGDDSSDEDDEQPVIPQSTSLSKQQLLGDDSSDEDDDTAEPNEASSINDAAADKKQAAKSSVRDLLGEDSSSDESTDQKKRKPLSDSDEDKIEEKKVSPQKKSRMLLSDDEDDQSREKAAPERRGSDAGSNDENAVRSEEERDEEVVEEVVAPPEEPEETIIEVDFPLIRANLGKEKHLVKMPNFLSVETRPFDASLYEDEIDEDEVMDEEGHTRLKLKVENTIRWRFAKDADGNPVIDPSNGNAVRESNARMVRWSDGSLSLHLGQEIFDMHPMDIRADYNHLFIRQGSGLQGQAMFKTKLTFRPHSTDSFTHRKITMSLATKTNKMQKVKILPIAGKNPETNRDELIKKEEERLRATLRRENMQRRIRERNAHRELSSALMEEDDSNTVSLKAIKNSSKAKKISTVYSSASDSSSLSSDEEPVRKKTKAKVLSDDDDENEKGKKSSSSDLSDSD